MIVVFVIAFFVLVDLLVLGIVFWFHLLNAFILGLIIALMVLIVGLGALFSAMTITIDEKRISWNFAFGLLKRSLQLSQIASCRTLETPWYHGWGIGRIPGGRYYRISGGSGVEMQLEDGSALRLGSDEPGKLLSALQRAKAS